MPLAVVVLGLGIFAQGTSELMLAGLLEPISRDLAVSIPDAGLLISAFAAGMLVGAPVLAVLTLRLPRRTALLWFVGVFAAAHVAGALAPGYGFLLVTRVVSAFVYAGFWAVAAVTAVGLVPSTARAKAMGIVAGGLTVATVVGLPLGTLVGTQLGWRAAFWGVAALSAVAAVAIRLTVPPGRPDPARLPRVADEVNAMRTPRLWVAFSTNALTTSALLVTFSYLAPLLTGVTGLPEAAVPAVLALYGVGTVAGITVAGRTTDARPNGTLAVALAGVAVVSVALGLAARWPVPVVALAGLLGFFGFATNPALNTRVFGLAGDAPTLAAATNISAFNMGITAGPWIGGIALGAGAGYPVLPWIGAGFAVLALGSVAVTARPALRSHTAVHGRGKQHRGSEVREGWV